jgi:type I restriction enzyme M protein
VDQATHNKIVSFIWGIADDVLRDLFKRGKYPDVILPMCVIRRMEGKLGTLPIFLDKMEYFL